VIQPSSLRQWRGVIHSAPEDCVKTANEDNRLVTGVVGAAAILAITAACYALSSKYEEHDSPKLRGIQLYHAWNFFQRRYDFLHSNFKRNSERSFSFNVLHHKVVALTGEDARQAFLSNPHFDAPEGFKILVGAVRVSPSAASRPEHPVHPDLRYRGSGMWMWRQKRARKGTQVSSTKG